MSDMERVFGSWTPGDPWPSDGPLGRERAGASFETAKMTLALDGTPKATARRRWLWAAGDDYDNSKLIHADRPELVRRHLETFIGIHRKYAEEGFRPESDDVMMMSNVAVNRGGFGLHFGAFCTTIASQASDEQLMEWLIPAYSMRIVGCLAQTELAHGSNVRGLQTTATYDKAAQQFVLHTPSLEASKAWPGNMGKTSNFAVVYANLIVEGKELGFHSFLCQLRDEHHKLMPGVELLELGPKIGDNATETGLMRLTHVRVPRTYMLSKYQRVTEDGTYVKDPKLGKTQYSTMTTIRAGLVMSAGYRLAASVTIAVRYSCVRAQGFKDTRDPNATRFSPENIVLDYANQQDVVLGELARAYAFTFTGKNIGDEFRKIMADVSERGDDSQMRSFHATSAGLKALCTSEVADGMGALRQRLGGNGVLLAAGVGPQWLDYSCYVVAEGDKVLLLLSTARFIIATFNEVRAGKSAAGLDYLAKAKDPAFDFSAGLRTSASTVADFLDLNQMVRLFENRVAYAVVSAGERMKQLIDAGTAYDDAWNECAIDLQHMSKQHCWLLVLQNFKMAAEGMEDPAVRAVLVRLCQLYALQNLAADFGAVDLTLKQRQLVKEAARATMAAVRPDAVALVDAFEFPDNALNSALGRADGDVYQSLYNSAKQSSLNAERNEPVPGYHEYLQPGMDTDFVAEHAAEQKACGTGGPKL